MNKDYGFKSSTSSSVCNGSIKWRLEKTVVTLVQVFHDLPIAQMQDVKDASKLNLLINHIDAAVYELIAEATTYNEALAILTNIYAKTPSPIFARYTLITCKQQAGESLDTYFQKLKRLSVDCNYQAVSAQVHKEEAIRDVLIGGMMSYNIRQRLLEDHNLTLRDAYNKACSLEIAQKNAEIYSSSSTQQNSPALNIVKIDSSVDANASDEPRSSALENCSAAIAEKCMFCAIKGMQGSFVQQELSLVLNVPKEGTSLKCVVPVR